jgi:predicted SprT family Zn-dependent metalloprotease
VSKKLPPTIAQYSAYQGAWEWFNQELFGGDLKPCHLNLRGHRGSMGFFSPCGWSKRTGGNEVIHEIAMNPAFLSLSLKEVMSTLVHEMCHQWRYEQGSPPRKGYHDLAWVEMMQEVGLIPSDTGKPGGAKTGQKMDHYIDPQGKFVKAVKKMPKKYVLPWVSGERPDIEKKPKAQKWLKLTCPECETPIRIRVEDEGREFTCDCGEVFLTSEELRDRREDERG